MSTDNHAKGAKVVIEWAVRKMKHDIARGGILRSMPGYDHFVMAPDAVFEQYVAALKEVNHREISDLVEGLIERRKAQQAIK